MDSEGSIPYSGASDQRFNVVYDPKFDRFFLEDEALQHERGPYGKWIVPPKPVTKTEEKKTIKDSVFLSGKDTDAHAAYLELENTLTSQKDHSTPLPALDFSSFQQLVPEASYNVVQSIDSAATTKPKKTHIQNYKNTNQEMTKKIAANTEVNDDHEVKWNGEVIRVQIPGLRSESESFGRKNEVDHAALRGEVVQSTDDQWLGSTYELKNLMRIRTHADGLRGVNTACRFVAVSSSESSESEEEQEVPLQIEPEESDLMPVFFRDDRVLFHARSRDFKGTIRRRILTSDFYNIRGDNGTLFEAVLASKIELLDEVEQLPYYHFRRGDKVLWVPENTVTTSRRQESNRDEKLTYKAKIIQVRSLNRFDLLLRTDRIVKKVPHKQLRPRNVSDFVSTTTLRRR